VFLQVCNLAMLVYLAVLLQKILASVAAVANARHAPMQPIETRSLGTPPVGDEEHPNSWRIPEAPRTIP
jgi:hypothetical protein